MKKCEGRPSGSTRAAVLCMERRAILIRGIVQGVGFRSFVFNFAARLKPHGFVRNQTSDTSRELR